jgi:hypothetical protein
LSIVFLFISNENSANKRKRKRKRKKRLQEEEDRRIIVCLKGEEEQGRLVRCQGPMMAS